MTGKMFAGFVVVLAVVLCVPVAAAAQSAPKGDFALFYSAVNDDDMDETFTAGGGLSFGVYVTPWLGLVADVSAHTKSVEDSGATADMTFASALGGIRLGRLSGKARPFVQVLTGATRAKVAMSIGSISFDESKDFFTIQPGAGVDIGVTDSIGIRIQADYRNVQHGNKWKAQYRGVAGVVFAFGSR